VGTESKRGLGVSLKSQEWPQLTFPRGAAAAFPQSITQLSSGAVHAGAVFLLRTSHDAIYSGGKISGIFKAKSVNMMRVIESIGIMGL